MDSTPVIKCDKCGRYKNRALTVDAIISKDNEILLIKRKNDPFENYWALPGGYVEFDEEVMNAVKREVQEETGLTTTSLKLFSVYSKPDRDPKQNISLIYIVQTVGETKAGDDAKECTWFDIKRLPDKVAFDHKLVIADYVMNCL